MIKQIKKLNDWFDGATEGYLQPLPRTALKALMVGALIVVLYVLLEFAINSYNMTVYENEARRSDAASNRMQTASNTLADSSNSLANSAAQKTRRADSYPSRLEPIKRREKTLNEKDKAIISNANAAVANVAAGDGVPSADLNRLLDEAGVDNRAPLR